MRRSAQAGIRGTDLRSTRDRLLQGTGRVVVAAILVSPLLRGFVGQMFLIPSESMEDTLHVNDRVLVEKLSSLKRGQIVFRDPGGWPDGDQHAGPRSHRQQFIGVSRHQRTEHLIKRAIGLPGDHVVCCDDQGRERQ